MANYNLFKKLYITFIGLNVFFMFLTFFYNYEHIFFFGKVVTGFLFYFILFLYLAILILILYLFIKKKEFYSYLLFIGFYFFNYFNTMFNYIFYNYHYLLSEYLFRYKYIINLLTFTNIVLLGLHLLFFGSLFIKNKKLFNLKIYLISILIYLYLIIGLMQTISISVIHDDLSLSMSIIQENDYFKNSYMCNHAFSVSKCYYLIGLNNKVEMPFSAKDFNFLSPSYHDYYYYGYAKNLNNDTYCGKIYNNDLRYLCYADLIKSPKPCNKVESIYFKKICYIVS